MDSNQGKGETTEEDMDLISFRKTNTSCDDAIGDLEKGEYILIKNKHTKGICHSINYLNQINSY